MSGGLIQRRQANLFLTERNAMVSRRRGETSLALNPRVVRRHNLGTVLELVRQRPRSRSELVEVSGLTRSSIGGLVAELSALNLVVERRSESDGSAGRPSPTVSIDESSFGVLAMEIKVDSLAAAVVGLGGTVIRATRRTHLRGIEAADATVDAIADLASSVVARTDLVNLLGAGVAIAGLVRSSDNHVEVAPHLKWTDVDLGRAVADALAHRLGVRLAVEVGNDADLGAIAESSFGAGRDADNMLYLSSGIGLGGSMVVNGRCLTGHSGFAGEFGHLQINPTGKQCGCGAIGCWETEVSSQPLLERAGIQPDHGAASRLISAAGQGDTAVLGSIAEWGHWIGVGLGGLINVFDPDLVVIGGSYGPILPFARESLEAELVRRRFRGLARDVPVVAGELGLDASLIGAADLVVDHLVADPCGVVAGSQTLPPSVRRRRK